MRNALEGNVDGVRVSSDDRTGSVSHSLDLRMHAEDGSWLEVSICEMFRGHKLPPTYSVEAEEVDQDNNLRRGIFYGMEERGGQRYVVRGEEVYETDPNNDDTTADESLPEMIKRWNEEYRNQTPEERKAEEEIHRLDLEIARYEQDQGLNDQPVSFVEVKKLAGLVDRMTNEGKISRVNPQGPNGAETYANRQAEKAERWAREAPYVDKALHLALEHGIEIPEDILGDPTPRNLEYMSKSAHDPDSLLSIGTASALRAIAEFLQESDLSDSAYEKALKGIATTRCLLPEEEVQWAETLIIANGQDLTQIPKEDIEKNLEEIHRADEASNRLVDDLSEMLFQTMTDAHGDDIRLYPIARDIMQLVRKIVESKETNPDTIDGMITQALGGEETFNQQILDNIGLTGVDVRGYIDQALLSYRIASEDT